ncbi:MAG: hypothetical protein IPN22_06530 [Bacteroidetes bacterium]|nr:hypothetical protein [Bacteroidota bacterium]
MEQDTLPTDSSSFHGVNWADARDNFVDGPLVLSGFDLGSDRNYIQQRSQIVISGFKQSSGKHRPHTG